MTCSSNLRPLSVLSRTKANTVLNGDNTKVEIWPRLLARHGVVLKLVLPLYRHYRYILKWVYHCIGIRLSSFCRLRHLSSVSPLTILGIFGILARHSHLQECGHSLACGVSCLNNKNNNNNNNNYEQNAADGTSGHCRLTSSWLISGRRATTCSANAESSSPASEVQNSRYCAWSIQPNKRNKGKTKKQTKKQKKNRQDRRTKKERKKGKNVNTPGIN